MCRPTDLIVNQTARVNVKIRFQYNKTAAVLRGVYTYVRKYIIRPNTVATNPILIRLPVDAFFRGAFELNRARVCLDK